MAIWKISGETGKALNTAQRSFESLNIQDPQVTKASMSSDKFVFKQIFKSPAEANGMELRQKVSVWRDGVRFFTGNIINRKSKDTLNGFQVDTTVQGPWWWMEQTPLSGNWQDDSGTTSERNIYTFATDELKANIQSLINRMISIGCPIELGSIDACFKIPRITLSGSSCADALVDLLRWIPDAVVWFNYAVTGHPTINVSRRLYMQPLTLQAGAPPVHTAELNQRLDLSVDAVKVDAADRDSKGLTKSTSSSAGTASTFPGSQIVTVSGPEITDVLPKNYFDHAEIKSAAIYKNNLVDFKTIQWLDPFLRQVLEDYGNYSLDLGPDLVYPTLQLNRQASAYPPEIRDKSGTVAPPELKYYLTKGQLQPWFGDAGIKSANLTIKATLSFRINCEFTGDDPTTYMTPWQKKIAEKSTTQSVTGAIGVVGANKVVWYFYESTAEVQAVDKFYATETTVYRAQDYEFVQPPAGLASNLLEAQSWTPHEGNIILKLDDLGGTNYLKSKINLSNSLTEHANMGALANEVEYDISSRATTIYLGPPSRMAYKGLVNKFRQSARDNINFIKVS